MIRPATSYEAYRKTGSWDTGKHKYYNLNNVKEMYIIKRQRALKNVYKGKKL